MLGNVDLTENKILHMFSDIMASIIINIGLIPFVFTPLLVF